MRLSNKEKKAAKLAADKAKGIKSLVLPMGPATHDKLLALQLRYGFEDWREMLTAMVDVVHDGAWPDVLPVPQHTYTPSQKMLRRLEREGKIQAIRMDTEDDNGL